MGFRDIPLLTAKGMGRIRRDAGDFDCLRAGGNLGVCVSEAPMTESSAVEDYLEIIHGLIDTKGYARVADVAEGSGSRRRAFRI